MSEQPKRFALLRLRRGRKRAILTLPGGVIPEDHDTVDEMCRWALAEGWKQIDITYLYGEPFDKHCTSLIEFAPPDPFADAHAASAVPNAVPVPTPDGAA